MPWQVEVTDEFTTWYHGLQPQQQDRINAAVDELWSAARIWGGRGSTPSAD